MTHTAELTRLFKQAHAQAGAFSHAQALAAGLHPMEIRRLAESGEWKRVLPGVYAATADGTPLQPLYCAWLWAGEDAVVSHRSAARLHGLEVDEPPRPEVIVPLDRRPRSRKVAVYRAALTPSDSVTLHGLPVTSVARTLLDLSSVVDRVDLAIAVESARRKGKSTVDGLERKAQQLGTRGRAGMKNLARVLADCRVRGWPLESALEVRFWWWLRGSGLPLPVPGLPFQDDYGPRGRLDFCYEKEHLAIETDGFEVHGEREQFEKDCRRWSFLAATGWRVIHVSSRWLASDPEEIRARILAALGRDQD